MSEEAYDDGEFLWLISLSDLMMLLFVFFVVLFSFSYKKVSKEDMIKMNNVIKGEVRPAALDETQEKLLAWVQERKFKEYIEISNRDDALVIQIKERLIFDSGSSNLKDKAMDLIVDIGKALKEIPAPYRIGIEGHTDNSFLEVDGFDGNWALSSQRALAVLKALELEPKVLRRVVVMAYGSQKPISVAKENKDIQKSRAQNRRVTIRIF